MPSGFNKYALKNTATGELLCKSSKSDDIMLWDDVLEAKYFYDKKIIAKRHFEIVGVE